MAGFKTPDFNERTAAARAAKQSALEKLRNKPAPDPELIAQREAAAAAREAAAAERQAARKLALEQAKAEKLANKKAASQKNATAPAKPQRTEAELKAARDAKYAARKARKR